MLLRRANGDLHVCRALADDMEVDDGPIGFHAQQAVEKGLKIALVLSDVELPRTHDLEFLVQLVRESGVDLPTGLSDTEWLTPWAADFRYGDPTALDRPAARSAAESAVAWAEALLADPSGGG
jgi:HEPN domain-containing protein